MAESKPADFPTVELERRISVAEAARIKGISPDTFKRHYSHLIEQISPRRQAVKLKHAIAENAA
jgi:hypothetical protein